MLLHAIFDQLMYKILLRNTTYFDFGRETWIKNFLKDCP